MKKAWIIVASLLLLVGLTIFVAVMTVSGWDFSLLVTDKITTVTYEIDGHFENLSILTDTSDITFKPSDNGRCEVVCNEFEKGPHLVSVKDGTLVIECANNRKWYDYIGISAGSDDITIYLPSAEYGNLLVDVHTGDVTLPNGVCFESVKIKTTTGKIKLDGTECKGDVTLSVSTGDLEIADVKCNSLFSKGTTGKVLAKNLLADSISIERDTGDVTLDSCDAKEIKVKTDTGDVEGSLLTEKVFSVKTSTGKINVPNSQIGGVCEISTDTGDIFFEINR